MQGDFESGRLRIVFSGYGIGFLGGVRLFFIGIFFEYFMLGMIGTDVYQVYYMHRIRPGLLRLLSLSVFLRLTGLLIIMLLAVVAPSLGAKTWVADFNIHLNELTLPGWVTINRVWNSTARSCSDIACQPRFYLDLVAGRRCLVCF